MPGKRYAKVQSGTLSKSTLQQLTVVDRKKRTVSTSKASVPVSASMKRRAGMENRVHEARQPYSSSAVERRRLELAEEKARRAQHIAAKLVMDHKKQEGQMREAQKAALQQAKEHKEQAVAAEKAAKMAMRQAEKSKVLLSQMHEAGKEAVKKVKELEKLFKGSHGAASAPTGTPKGGMVGAAIKRATAVKKAPSTGKKDGRASTAGVVLPPVPRRSAASTSARVSCPAIEPSPYEGFERVGTHRGTGIYVLELYGGYIYVGKSTDVKRRVAQHMAGSGAAFTKLHKPTGKLLKRLGTLEGDGDGPERDETLRQMFKHGPERVRGWKYCGKNLARADFVEIEENIRELFDLCRKCGQKGHFAAQCGARRF